MDIFIRPGEGISAIYDDRLRPLMERAGSASLKRASRVEPTECLSTEACTALVQQGVIEAVVGRMPLERLLELFPTSWWADLQLSRGPVLGPFDEHSQAIQAEKDWLAVNHFGVQADAS